MGGSVCLKSENLTDEPLTLPRSRHNEFAKARTQFKTAVSKGVDWPESIWTAWITFEDYHGTAESLNAAKIRVGLLQEALAAQRMQVSTVPFVRKVQL